MKGWLFKNIDKFSKVIEDVEDINYIYSTFVETNDPDAVVAKLYDAVGKSIFSVHFIVVIIINIILVVFAILFNCLIINYYLETRQLVRHLWKWSVLEIHAHNYKKLADIGRVF